MPSLFSSLHLAPFHLDLPCHLLSGWVLAPQLVIFPCLIQSHPHPEQRKLGMLPWHWTWQRFLALIGIHLSVCVCCQPLWVITLTGNPASILLCLPQCLQKRREAFSFFYQRSTNIQYLCVPNKFLNSIAGKHQLVWVWWVNPNPFPLYSSPKLRSYTVKLTQWMRPVVHSAPQRQSVCPRMAVAVTPLMVWMCLKRECPSERQLLCRELRQRTDQRQPWKAGTKILAAWSH